MLHMLSCLFLLLEEFLSPVSCFTWPWHFLMITASYFVECASIWVGGFASKFTHVANGRLQFLTCWPLHRAAYNMVLPRESNQDNSRKKSVFYHPILEMTYHYFCYILLVIQTNSGTLWKRVHMKQGSLEIILEAGYNIWYLYMIRFKPCIFGRNITEMCRVLLTVFLSGDTRLQFVLLLMMFVLIPSLWRVNQILQYKGIFCPFVIEVVLNYVHKFYDILTSRVGA